MSLHTPSGGSTGEGRATQLTAGAPWTAPSGLEEIRFDRDGLVPAIVQEADTKEVLMMAWMDEEALRRTLTSGRTWLWSRSRQEYWCKGETSGDRQYVREVRYDCDGDALLILVRQEGRGACHTGERSCFFRTLDP